jgi:hypothetical protein
MEIKLINPAIGRSFVIAKSQAAAYASEFDPHQVLFDVIKRIKSAFGIPEPPGIC